MQKNPELGYDDIGLIPRRLSNVDSRRDVNPLTKFCGQIVYPIVASPMPDVCDGNFAYKLYLKMCYGFIHRFMTIDEQVRQYHKVMSTHCGCALGLHDYKERFTALSNIGCESFLIDCANGASRKVLNCIEDIHNMGAKYITVGNISSVETYNILKNYPIYAVRVGLSMGAACSTKIETGVCRPMVSTLQEIWTNKKDKDPLVIADGSISKPADMCKALLWSDLVMCGKIFAQSSDSPARTLRIDGKLKKVYRGAASYSTQIDHKNEKPTFVEGMETLLDIGPSLESIVDRFINGLRSSMSYMDANNLMEFRQNADYCIIR